MGTKDKGEGERGVVGSMGWFVDMSIGICVSRNHCAYLIVLVSMCELNFGCGLSGDDGCW